MSKNIPFLIVIALLAIFLGRPAQANPQPKGDSIWSTEKVRSYYPISKASNIYGVLTLSKNLARFSEQTGTMQLKFASEINVFEIPDAVDKGLLGADIYRVVNFQQYFLLGGKGKNGFCRQPIRWLTVTQEAASRIWVCGYDIEKIQDYQLNKPGVCFCGMWEIMN